MQDHDNCLSCKRKLSAYIDGELSSALMEAVEVHLASCSDCRKELALLRAAVEALDVLKTPEPRRELDVEVMSRITQTGEKRHLYRLLPAPLYAAAIGLFFGVFLASGVTGQTAAPPVASDDAIRRAADVFSPSPQGSFSNAYFAMLSGTDW
jgi:anti-sigma factor RsiW